MQRINRLSENPQMIQLGNLIKRNKLGFSLVFSRAHIRDLLKSSKSREIIERYVYPDLEHINTLTSKQYIEYDLFTGRVYPAIADAKDLFDENLSSGSELIGFDSLFSHGSEDTEMNSLSQMLFEELKQRPSGINFSDSEAYPYYLKIFQRTVKDDNQYNMLKDFSDFLKGIENDPTPILELGELFLFKIGIDPTQLSVSSDPIAEIDDALKQSSFNTGFWGMTKLKINDPIFKTNYFFFHFLFEYVILDLAGYHRDKLGGKNKYSNYLHDILHAFYGCFCDYFVSSDKDLIKKAQVLYKHHNLDTKAVKPEDFINEVSSKVKSLYNYDDIVQSKNNLAYTGEINELMLCHPNILSASTYLLTDEVLGYFNRITYIEYIDNTRSELLWRMSNLLAQIIFPLEMAGIVEKLCVGLGNDVNGKGKLTKFEHEDIYKNNWHGREWFGEFYNFKLLYDHNTKKMNLVIVMNKN